MSKYGLIDKIQSIFPGDGHNLSDRRVVILLNRNKWSSVTGDFS